MRRLERKFEVGNSDMRTVYEIHVSATTAFHEPFPMSICENHGRSSNAAQTMRVGILF